MSQPFALGTPGSGLSTQQAVVAPLATQSGRWLALSLLGILLGLALVQYLTAHPLRMSLYLLASCSCLFASIWIWTTLFSGRHLLLALLLWLASLLAGYGYMTRRVLSREDPRLVAPLRRGKGDPGNGHTAVIYLTHGEPETYDPSGWINTFREIDATGVRFVPYLIRPLFLFRLRNAYLRLGHSPHRRVHQQMIASLERTFRAEGDRATRFYLCFLDDEPRPDAAVVQALNEGASRVIVMPVFVSVSNHTVEGEEVIRALGVQEYGVTLRFAEPLWNSHTLHRMFLERANAAIGNVPKEHVGVLLVGHGQPAEWDRQFPTATDHEIAFRTSALQLFEEDGYRPENLAMAWMEFRSPKPAEKAKEFIQNGVRVILYFAAAISAESLHSQYDIPELVHQAGVPEGFPLVNLGAWNDHPLVIQAIKERIAEQIQGKVGTT